MEQKIHRELWKCGWHLDFQIQQARLLLDMINGNGNHWTLNNYSTDNAILDTPTNNFPTWNPTTLTMGNSNGTLTNEILSG